ncbi:hypothetical protein ACLKMH_14780 [Psychromonas sp. KJ10-10]|uniref:hypothetical protein n=1 Tax=Psychromonas sp. KJ10-10 TaxID=3391823 RepID=UPI0039B65461
MVSLSGENWSGSIVFAKVNKARGKIDGYSWFLQANGQSLIIEIAEEQHIQPDELPLVGFGCSGWLYESDKTLFSENEDDFIIEIRQQLFTVFTLFKQNKLNYLPAVSCPCSE